MKKDNERIMPVLYKYSPLLLIIFIAGSFFWHGSETPTFLHPTNSIISATYRMIVAFAGVGATFGLTYKHIQQDNNNIIIRVTNELGQQTLGLYAVQALIITLVINILSFINLPYVIYVTAIFVIATFVSYFVVKLLALSKITALLFLGKNDYRA